MPDVPGMPVRQLATLVTGDAVGPSDSLIVDVTHDSRDIQPGSLFVAIRGHVADGHDYVSSAVQQGASAVCVDDLSTVPENTAAIVVDDTRAALGLLAAAVHGTPSEHLQITGITGTNGKTTVAYLLRSMLSQSGGPVGLIGTNGAFIGEEPVPNARTTPEASDLQRILGDMVRAGVTHVVMEVSSHALSLHRVAGTHFAVAAFTNLSQDHLDFHVDMDEYFEAKARLFALAANGVVSLETSWGEKVLALPEKPSHVVTVGDGGALQAEDVSLTATGSSFILVGAGPDRRVSLSIPGRFNVNNALVAIGCARALGLGLAQILEGLASIEGVPGRFERVGRQSPAVFVDYAHTPDGIAEAIAAAREFTSGRVIVVVGAGGDRDVTKRPLMGAAASSADVLWITSDNPRSEDPDSIIAAVVAGASTSTPHVEVDRRVAIRAAIHAAVEDDTVLILGKGHEQGQDIGGVVLPFDDRVEVAEVLKDMSR